MKTRIGISLLALTMLLGMLAWPGSGLAKPTGLFARDPLLKQEAADHRALAARLPDKPLEMPRLDLRLTGARPVGPSALNDGQFQESDGAAPDRQALAGDIYVDATSGHDDTGDGTSGNPYKSLTKALSITNATGGGRIYATSGASSAAFGIAGTGETFPLAITASNTTLANWSGHNAPVIDATDAGTFNVIWIHGTEATRLSNINIGGSGDAVLEIKNAASNNGLYVIDVEYANNFNVHDVCIYDVVGGIANVNTTVRGISCENTSNGTVRDCSIENFLVNNGQGIVFGSGSNSTVTGCKIFGIGPRADLTGAPIYGTDGIWFFATNGLTARNNVVGGSAEADKIKGYNTVIGIAFNGRADHEEDTCNNLTVQDNLVQYVEACEFAEPHDPTIYALGIAGVNCLNYNLTGNQVYHSMIGIGFEPLISAGAQAAAGRKSALAYSQTISGNTCQHNTVGIGLMDSAPGIRITNNDCSENVQTVSLDYLLSGIGIALTGSDFSGAVISGNRCNGNGNEAAAGLLVGGMGIGMLSRLVGAAVEPDVADFTSMTVTDNECSGNYLVAEAIAFFGGIGIGVIGPDISGSTYRGNVCQDNQVRGEEGTVFFGAHGLSLAGEGSRVVVDGNRCDRNQDLTGQGMFTGIGLTLGIGFFAFGHVQDPIGSDYTDCQVINNQASDNLGGIGVGIMAAGTGLKISRNSPVDANKSNSTEGFMGPMGGSFGMYIYGSDNEVSYNRCWNNRSNVLDVGETGLGIYLTGTGSRIFWNDCRDNGSFGYALGGSDLRIYRNIASGHNTDIDYEEYHYPACGLYTENFNYGASALAAGDSNLVENNTFVNNHLGLYLLGDEENDPTEIRNNILAFNSVAAAGAEATGLAPVFDYNDLYANSALVNLTAGPGCITIDPMFVNYRSDWHLIWGSPAIDKGDPALAYRDPDLTRNDMGVFFYNQMPAPLNPSVLINGGDAYTNDRNVILTLDCLNACDMYIYGDVVGEGGVKRKYALTYPVTLTEGQGDKTVRVVFANCTGSAEDSDSINYSTDIPVSRAFELSDRTSGSKLFTNEDEVDLAISEALARVLFFKSAEEAAQSEPPVISQMIYSENSDFSGASWQTYATATTFTLSAAEGNKTVYGKFKNQAGNESSATTASILLDKTPPNPLANIQTSRGTVIELGDPIGRAGINIKGILTDLLSGIDPETIAVSLAPLAEGGILSLEAPAEIQETSISYDPVTGMMTCSETGLTPGDFKVEVNCSDKAGNPMTQFYIDLVEVLAADAPEGVFEPTRPVVVRVGNEYRITYSLTADLPVDLRIYNMAGAMIWASSIVAGAEGGALGYNSVAWDGRDAFDQPLKRGVYIVRMISNGKLVGTVRFVII